MAVKPQNNDVFLREVDEELRRDQMVAFGRRWGVLIAVVVVVALAALAGSLWWQHHLEVVAGERGEQYQTALDAMDAAKPADAAKPLADLSQAKGGYKAMAMFSQADILLGKNDLKGAAARFGAIADDASLAKPFRDLALIRETSAEYDTLKPEQVVDRLRPLAVQGSPWLASAGEMVAIAYMRMNKPDLAGQLFAQIAHDDTAPDTARQRAVQMASVLGIDATAGQDQDKAAR